LERIFLPAGKVTGPKTAAVATERWVSGWQAPAPTTAEPTKKTALGKANKPFWAKQRLPGLVLNTDMQIGSFLKETFTGCGAAP
jgi:hypothetical protein